MQLCSGWSGYTKGFSIGVAQGRGSSPPQHPPPRGTPTHLIGQGWVLYLYRKITLVIIVIAWNSI